MARCLELAAQGMRDVAPNPLVGCVIVEGGQIVAEGFHRKFGDAHAERDAIDALPEKIARDRATLYVNLEPCTHHGKTPPCADFILEKGIRDVVVGVQDPNPIVRGRGIAKLKSAGVSVRTGVMERECREFNKRFFCFQTLKRPYVILKWAETYDGYLSREDGSARWISSRASRELTHRWRAEEQSILVGTNTAVQDNPQLTVRHVDGHDPIRLFVDFHGRTPATHHRCDSAVPAWCFTSAGKALPDSVVSIPIPEGKDSVPSMLAALWERGIASVLVEGGSKLLTSFIQSGYWDEARVFRAPIVVNGGVQAPALNRDFLEKEELVDIDTLREYRNPDPEKL